ncbi:MAG: hypothetical protein AB8B87_13210 [Granulosicoccus sp.]
MPHRTVADTGSFPVNPDGVAQWLTELNPLQSEIDARKVYSGLKHSNRLHNDVDQRRSVISCFVPVLRDLHCHLSELSDAQPLPLTREFARNARLRDSLLREEAFAFKILLSDSEKPLADDARRAMQALARQAESVVHAFRGFPDALIEDAHQLYALAEEHKLLSSHQGSELLSLQDHYRFILLLSVSDLSQQRARQLPLVLDFLRDSVSDIHIERQRPPQTVGNTDYAIDMRQGSRPEPTQSLLSLNQRDVRWFSVAPLLYRIDQKSAEVKSRAMGVPGSDILERQSLARLHVAVSRSRQRRLARCITALPKRVVFGHKEICAHLLFRPTEIPADNESSWVVTNETLHGMCLHNEACRAGLVQVGELISVTDPEKALMSQDAPQSSKIDALMGVIRWIRAGSNEQITIGVEFLARTVLPVHVTRETFDTDTNLAIYDGQEISENAVIIACKFQNTIIQTMLLPSYLYQTNDKLVVSQGGKSRNVKLNKCLQSNGLFSQFSLVDS